MDNKHARILIINIRNWLSIAGASLPPQFAENVAELVGFTDALMKRNADLEKLCEPIQDERNSMDP